MTPLLSTDGAKGEEWPATVRGWATGLYLRDQWQITPKMTASVGVRWEYYPFPTRTDRGLEMFDFTTNLLQVCGIGAANAQVCDIKVQKDLFTPRLGWAYRPTEDTVIRVGFSRNPQSDNAITPCRRHRAGISAGHSDHRVWSEHLHSGGLAECGCAARAGAGSLDRESFDCRRARA